MNKFTVQDIKALFNYLENDLVKINTVEDVKAFFSYMTNDFNLNFNPDDPMESYADIDTGERIFSAEEAEKLTRLVDDCFIVCEKGNLDIHLIGLEILAKSVGLYFEDDKEGGEEDKNEADENDGGNEDENNREDENDDESVEEQNDGDNNKVSMQYWNTDNQLVINKKPFVAFYATTLRMSFQI